MAFGPNIRLKWDFDSIDYSCLYSISMSTCLLNLNVCQDNNNLQIVVGADESHVQQPLIVLGMFMYLGPLIVGLNTGQLSSLSHTMVKVGMAHSRWNHYIVGTCCKETHTGTGSWM